jgi:hypothetical protein
LTEKNAEIDFPVPAVTACTGGLSRHTRHAVFVIDSYRLVIGGLPKSEQPVDPRTYGRRA